MLVVDTYIGQSTIHGVGIFAAQPISKGTVVWEFNSLVDLKLSLEQIDSLSPPCRKQMLKYAYFSNTEQLYILCGDDARFFNHSADPSCTDGEFVTFAARDLQPGDEITSDYATFDGRFDEKEVE